MKIGIIEIEQMEFYAFHGCYKQEQVVGNRFLVNLVFETNIEKASKSDNVEDTVSYLDVYNVVKQQMAIRSDILENVGERILDSIKKEFPSIIRATIKITKCNPPLGGNIKGVSVSQSF